MSQKFYTEVVGQEGMAGDPLPYRLHSDWMVTVVLFVCFVLVSYVLSRGKKRLRQQFKNFFMPKERSSLFDDSTASDMRCTLVLIFQTCILSGFCIYDYFSDHNPQLFHEVSHALLLSLFVGYSVCFLIVKWLVYSFVNWIFFDKARNLVWAGAYFNVVIGIGFLLFPVVLLIVYFDLSPQIAPFFVGFVLIIAKTLLLYKCFTNFFSRFHGVFHLILYFCTLELLPYLVLWKGIVLTNNILVLNF